MKLFRVRNWSCKRHKTATKDFTVIWKCYAIKILFFSSACMSRASGVDTITKHIGKSHFVLYVLRIETSNIYSLHLRFRKSHICWKRLWYPKNWTIPEFTQNISYNWRAFLNPHCGENLVGVLMLQVNTSVLHSFQWKGSKERDVENSEKLH